MIYFNQQTTQMKQIINNKHNTNMNNKEQYTPPLCEVIALETIGMLAISGNKGIEGWGHDSDDSEFGGAKERRDTWGNLWETEN